MTSPPRVLVVDDSSFMRLALRRIIEADADLLVVGEAADGLAGVEAAGRLHPDLVVMDLAMPVMGGIEATRRIMAMPAPPAIVVVSAHTRNGSAQALEALDQGAADYLWKDSDLGGPDLARLDRELRPILHRWAAARRPPEHPLPRSERPALADARPEVLVIGASTGGPEALAAFLEGCGPLPIPCVVAQHMPMGLAPELASVLSRRLSRPVVVAEDGMALSSGLVALLPGGSDGALVRRAATGALALRLAPTAAPVHPSVDVLFRSTAATATGALGVVLSGMGRDGAEGAAAMAARGMPVMAQQPESCIVGGMPGAVIAAGLAWGVAPPAVLGAQVANLLATMPRSAP